LTNKGLLRFAHGNQVEEFQAVIGLPGDEEIGVAIVAED
jgi:hypothetical protein